MTKNNKEQARGLTWWEQRDLERNGCTSTDWKRVRVHDGTDTAAIVNVRFEGDVTIGNLCPATGTLRNCTLKNCVIGDDVTITDTERVEFEPESRCGVGTMAGVLDETGSRPVAIYPGLSSQTAMLMAREPKWAENHLMPGLRDWLMSYSAPNRIGDRARITGCGTLLNVCVDPEVTIEGARRLHNGTVVNNAAPGRCLTYIGAGVDAENFIIEDGKADCGAIIRNCYIGQGAVLDKGFTAHDSLFFANCSLENGEACAVFAGPYTVSMHKSTLLIGCQTSFMNAGSGTNQSNHMYKLGPAHWGVLERGVKTSSASYLMLGARIGAFSLLMGQHKTHPDSSQFPFSYLFGDDGGATVVVPAMMLHSCGLLRDEKKWPARDRRLKRHIPLHDRIIFDVLNPRTVDKMLGASDVIDDLLSRPADDDRVVRYRGMKFRRAGLERARVLYEWAICKYLSIHVPEGFGNTPMPDDPNAGGDWVDIAGLPLRRDWLGRVMECHTVQEMEDIFSEAYERYRELEREWIAARFPERWRKSPEVIAEYAANFDRMVEEDRIKNLTELKAQNDMLEL